MNDDFENDLRRQLRDSESNIDPQTRARLAAARRTALAEDTPGQSFGLPAWSSAIAVALVVAIAVQLYLPNGSQPDNAGQEEIEIYENLEMLELYEDLEFYEWLAATGQEEAA